MKQLLLVLCMCLTTNAWSQKKTTDKTADKTTEKYVLLKVTEREGKVVKVDTVMVNSSSQDDFEKVHAFASSVGYAPIKLHFDSDSLHEVHSFASSVGYAPIKLHFDSDSLHEVHSLSSNWDKLFVGGGSIQAYSSSIPDSLSTLFLHLNEKNFTLKNLDSISSGMISIYEGGLSPINIERRELQILKEKLEKLSQKFDRYIKKEKGEH